MDNWDTLPFTSVPITRLQGVQLTTCVQISLLPTGTPQDTLAFTLQKICSEPLLFEWMDHNAPSWSFTLVFSAAHLWSDHPKCIFQVETRPQRSLTSTCTLVLVAVHGAILYSPDALKPLWERAKHRGCTGLGLPVTSSWNTHTLVSPTTNRCALFVVFCRNQLMSTPV